VAALFARLRGQGRQVAGNKDLGVAVAASDHLQWGPIAHDNQKPASIVPVIISAQYRLQHRLESGKITLPVAIFTLQVKAEISLNPDSKPPAAQPDKIIRFRSPFALRALDDLSKIFF
jgi:hypothetical protein